MPASTVLQQISAEREALVASIVPRAVAVAVSRRRVLSGIHWRGAFVITAAEALGGADRVRLAWHSDGVADSGSEIEEAEIAARDLTTDVAIIRTKRPPAEPVAVREDLRLGESVAIVGRDARGPLGAWGMVGVAGPAWRSLRGGAIACRLEIAARLDERLEGALIADTTGRAAAMLVAGPRNRALGIPAATIERVLQSIELRGYLPRPYLGVRLQALWLDSAAVTRFGRRSRRIPVVAGVEIGSPAASAGLEPGDLIEAIEGHEVDGIDELMRAIAAAGVGGTIRLGLRRGGGLQDRSITVAEQPRDAR
jgi:S1-C subfamily serine protease